jgi:hypothetical protein
MELLGYSVQALNPVVLSALLLAAVRVLPSDTVFALAVDN